MRRGRRRQSTSDALDEVAPTNTSPRYERWVALTSWPLLGAALIFLAAYSLPILHPALPETLRAVCRSLVWATWAAFAIDYLGRFVLVPRRWAFVRSHWFDLLFIVLPVLRPLALLRLVTVFLVLDRHAGSRLRSRIGLYVAGGTALLVFAAAVAVLDVERGAPGASITGFGDAVWWACATITTVGYGDVYPVTLAGRAIAVGLMVGGVALLGVVTASFASWFVEIIQRAPGARGQEIADDADELARLRRQVASLERRLAAEDPAPGR